MKEDVVESLILNAMRRINMADPDIEKAISENKRNKLIEKASNLISKDRAEDYGDAKECHQLIAHYWNSYLKHTPKSGLRPVDVAIMMILLKIARCRGTLKDDTFIDIIGYSALAGEMIPNEILTGDFEYSEKGVY